jgi:hypothetical protein
MAGTTVEMRDSTVMSRVFSSTSIRPFPTNVVFSSSLSSSAPLWKVWAPAICRGQFQHKSSIGPFGVTRLTAEAEWDAHGRGLHVEDAHHRFIEGDDTLVAEIDMLALVGTVDFISTRVCKRSTASSFCRGGAKSWTDIATAFRLMRACFWSGSKQSQSAPKTTLALNLGSKPSTVSSVPVGVSYICLSVSHETLTDLVKVWRISHKVDQCGAALAWTYIVSKGAMSVWSSFSGAGDSG